MSAAAVEADGCGYGTGGKYASTICWFDFSAFDMIQARSSAGQSMSITLDGGYVASFTAKVTDVAGTVPMGIEAKTAPLETRFAFGDLAYESIPGSPVLYSLPGETGIMKGATVSLQNISVVDSNGATVRGFSFVAADAEDNTAGESFRWNSDKPLKEIERLTNNSVWGCAAPTGLGTTTVTCQGTGTGPSQAYSTALLVGADTPARFDTTWQTTRRSGIAIGIQTAKVSLSKTVASRANPSDSFDLAITSPEGTRLGSASTGNQNSATTGSITVLPRSDGQAFTLAEVATPGTLTNLAEYRRAWSCVNTTTGASLPGGTGTSLAVRPAVGDDISCRVTNTALPKFTCTANAPGLLFQGAPTTEYAIDLITGESTTVKSAMHPQNINGVGFNVLDGYVYGNTTTAPYDIVRVGADGGVQVLGPQPAGAAGFVMGDVDADGHYWAMSGTRWYEIDLTPGSPTYLQVLATGTATPPAGMGLGFDWAFVPGGGDYLYATAIVTSNNLAALVRFNMTTHQWENRGYLGYPSVTPTGAVEAAGAVYADADGFLYASYNTSGRIYRVDVNPDGNSTGAFFSQGPASATNDGARCAQSAIRIDFGDAPAGYGTLLTGDGPRHGIAGYDEDAKTASLMLGSRIDADQDGRPTATADGDDTLGIDDEDAFSGPIVINPGATGTTLTVPLANTTGSAATLYGWIDANGNGTFDANEMAQVAVPAGATSVELPFAFAAPLSDGLQSMLRLRLTSDTLTSPLGAASDGEIEDHRVVVATVVPVSCVAPFVETFGTGPNYQGPLPAGQTTYPWGNPADWQSGNRYTLLSQLKADAWSTAQWLHPGTDHTGDPQGLMMMVDAAASPGLFFQKTFTGLLPGSAYDFGAWISNVNPQTNVALPNVIFRVVDPATGDVLATVDTGDIAATAALEWERYGLAFTATQSTVRLELVNNSNSNIGNDLALDDISLAPACEFGDAPDSYGTTLGAGGPAHVAVGPTLGVERDSETDGQPTDGADGDDVTGTDDEDGVDAELVVVSDRSSTVAVTATNDSDVDVTLAGWIDLDGDGTFDDAERVLITVPANSGTAEYELDFPAGTTTKDTYARFRIFGEVVGDPRPTGAASAGEVEDYLVTVRVAATLQVLKVGEDSTGSVVPMTGSAWAVYEERTGGTALIDPIASVVDAGSPVTGLFRDTSLTEGTYWLEETTALPGFELLAHRVPFVVAADGAVTLGASASANITLVDVDGVQTIRVEDVPKLELPEAGGPGTLAFSLTGLSLLVAAGAVAAASAIRRQKASQRVQGRKQ